MTPTSRDLVWASRLRTSDFSEQMGFDSLPDHEIPHVNGMPVGITLPEGAIVVREWPNLAGRLEYPAPDDIVRWHRALAPAPPHGRIVPRGSAVDGALLAEMRQWLGKFARSLTQLRGVSLAIPSESAKAIILTPQGVGFRSDLPHGVDPVPGRLAEFPGGIVLTMDPVSFEQRAEYADAVNEIIMEA